MDLFSLMLEQTKRCPCGGEKRLATEDERATFPDLPDYMPPGSVARVCSKCGEQSALAPPLAEPSGVLGKARAKRR